MARATSMAGATGLTRGVAQVGIRRAAKDKDREMRKQKPKEFRITGTKPWWDPDAVTNLLRRANFTEIQLLSMARPRRGTSSQSARRRHGAGAR